jgi:RNA polymerase sigma-70 factor (ECF subfamily)
MGDSGSSDSTGPARGGFATTRWSVVVAAGAQSTTAAKQALERLCQAYWQPVYAFIRRTGHEQEDARDLTQNFFVDLIADKSIGRADPDRGRFRSFLLGALKHFLADARDRANARKRGGGCKFVPLDTVLAEERYGARPSADGSPDREYDRAWALSVLDRALQRLREEFVLSGRESLFDGLKGFLSGDKPSPSFATVAVRLRMTEGAAKMTVTRLRQRFRALVRQELAHTVLTSEELDEELREFTAILRGGR